MFSNYDNTITVGNALENNKILKGGKWKAVEMNGRDYVTYTVRLTEAQIQELIKERLSPSNWDYNFKDKPNHAIAYAFRKAMEIKMKGITTETERLAKVTSMSGEEVNQAFEIFSAKLNAFDRSQNNDIEPLLTVDGYEITVSFVMNQDDTFDINMMEIYTEVTLKCFNNLKVRLNVGNSENAQSILSYIYKGFTPNLF